MEDKKKMEVIQGGMSQKMHEFLDLAVQEIEVSPVGHRNFGAASAKVDEIAAIAESARGKKARLSRSK